MCQTSAAVPLPCSPSPLRAGTGTEKALPKTGFERANEKAVTEHLRTNWVAYHPKVSGMFREAGIDIGEFQSINQAGDVSIGSSWRGPSGRPAGPRLDIVVRCVGPGGRRVCVVIENKPKGYCEAEIGQVFGGEQRAGARSQC